MSYHLLLSYNIYTCGYKHVNYGIKKHDIVRKLKFYKFEFLRKLVVQYKPMF